jgi:hypothetical protein
VENIDIDMKKEGKDVKQKLSSSVLNLSDFSV